IAPYTAKLTTLYGSPSSAPIVTSAASPAADSSAPIRWLMLLKRSPTCMTSPRCGLRALRHMHCHGAQNPLLTKNKGRGLDLKAAPQCVLYAFLRVDQSSGAERRLLTCCGDTGVPWLPHDIRMYVTTAATSVSDSACANGGMPCGIGLPSVLGG